MFLHGSQPVPDYSLGTTGIVPMAYEEILPYETLNVAYDYK